jgi:hypothetical protein
LALIHYPTWDVKTAAVALSWSRADRRAAFGVIGADDNGGFLALGAQAGEDGEREVLDIPRGFVENTWPSFVDFVRAQHRYRTRDLQEESACSCNADGRCTG